MKKTPLASALAVAFGVTGHAGALTMNMTTMAFNGPSPATGTLNSSGGGTFTSVTPFFGAHWTADGVAFFGTTGAHTWNSPTSPQGSYSYHFSLTASQVAWGVFFDWNQNLDIPVLNIMTCPAFTVGTACTATGTPVQTPPISGQFPHFHGTIASASTPAVPVPAAAWLMGAGLAAMLVLRRRCKNA